MCLLLVQPYHLVLAVAACRMQPVERCEREAGGVKLTGPACRPRPYLLQRGDALEAFLEVRLHPRGVLGLAQDLQHLVV